MLELKDRTKEKLTLSNILRPFRLIKLENLRVEIKKIEYEIQNKQTVRTKELLKSELEKYKKAKGRLEKKLQND